MAFDLSKFQTKSAEIKAALSQPLTGGNKIQVEVPRISEADKAAVGNNIIPEATFEALAKLRQGIEAKLPELPQILQVIHAHLLDMPGLVHILHDDQIRDIIEAFQISGKTLIVPAGKAKSTKQRLLQMAKDSQSIDVTKIDLEDM